MKYISFPLVRLLSNVWLFPKVWLLSKVQLLSKVWLLLKVWMLSKGKATYSIFLPGAIKAQEAQYGWRQNMETLLSHTL